MLYRMVAFSQWHHSLLTRVDKVQGPGDAKIPRLFVNIFFSVGILPIIF